MKDLINDLLQYSRVAHEPMDVALINMNELMTEIILLFRSELYQKNGTLVVLNDLPKIRAVKTSIIQVMQNLISNAIKFRGPENPEITVASEETPTDWIFIVQDNGIRD
jgi:light-regulated signal transduction histidine kinase (bacteriophytochrome)